MVVRAGSRGRFDARRELEMASVAGGVAGIINPPSHACKLSSFQAQNRKIRVVFGAQQSSQAARATKIIVVVGTGSHEV